MTVGKEGFTDSQDMYYIFLIVICNIVLKITKNSIWLMRVRAQVTEKNIPNFELNYVEDSMHMKNLACITAWRDFHLF